MIQRGETIVRQPKVPPAAGEWVAFELLAELTQFSGAWVQAARRTWDPSANAGAGGYTTDCADTIYVADLLGTGHTAGKNGLGGGRWRKADNGWVVEIWDLCCPGDEQGTCP